MVRVFAVAAGIWFVLGGTARCEGYLARSEEAASGGILSLDVFPAAINFRSRGETMRAVAVGSYDGGLMKEVTREATFETADPKIARWETGRLAAVADGNTELIVRAGGLEKRVPIAVFGQNQKRPTPFEHGAIVALTRQGCNSGACHGSPSGKGGFRLSLRGYDPALDAETIVREAMNRRVNLLEPEKSLLLQKPLMEISHGGGRRLKHTDESFAILRDWITEGCKEDTETTPICERLEVYPKKRILTWPAFEQQIVAVAHFSDGSMRDVTRLVNYSSSNGDVASVSDDGLVAGKTRGESAILVRYLDKMQTADLMFLKPASDFEWPNPKPRNYIDEHIFAKLKTLEIAPSEPANDEVFVRRVFLDAIGVLPTIEETKAFVASQDPEKRSRLIDNLLERPEYADFWTLKLADLLRVRNGKLTAKGVSKFHHWLHETVRDNMPFDEFARRLLTARGSSFENPAANYFRAAADTDDCTETTSQLFLGARIQCAKCHNHPFEKWTQDNYYGIGAFFNRVQRKAGASPDEQIVWVARSGEVTQPRTKEQIAPWLPGQETVAAPGDRREAFANWLTAPGNPFFAKVAVNRMWGQLFGRGIVEPVDDFRESNPPAHAEVLDALAKDFGEHGFDRKHVLRVILNSRTYQASARANESNNDDLIYFSHYPTRLLTAEQALDAVCQVTGVSEKFAGAPLGVRAAQLVSPDAGNEFMKVFGQPSRETACQCERSQDANVSQALAMINGPVLHDKVQNEQNRFRTLLAEGKPAKEVISQLYLAALCRRPSESELAIALDHVNAAEDATVGLEDVCWAILNTHEFLFQH